MPPMSIAASLFELLELPDGRCYVARPAPAATTLVAGSFAQLEPPLQEAAADDAARIDPVGVYPSRDQAEIAILRASPSLRAVDPLALFAALLGRD